MMNYEQFKATLYGMTIAMRHRIAEEDFLEITSTFSCGEHHHGAVDLIFSISASGLGVYDIEHRHLAACWEYMKEDKSMPPIAILEPGQGPWGPVATSVSRNPEETYAIPPELED